MRAASLAILSAAAFLILVILKLAGHLTVSWWVIGSLLLAPSAILLVFVLIWLIVMMSIGRHNT